MNQALLILLSLGHLATDISQGALPALNLFLAAKLHLNYFQVGMVSLSFTLSSAFLQPLLGYWSDSRRVAWLLPVSCLAAGLGLALTGVVRWYILLLAAVFVSGVGVAGYHPEGSKMACHASGRYNRGLSMSFFSLGGNVGTALGPVVAYCLVGGGKLSHTVFLMGPGLIMAALLVSALHSSAQRSRGETLTPAAPPGGGDRAAIRSLLLLLGYVAARSWLQSGLVYFLPFYLINVAGRTTRAATFTLAAFLVAGAAGTVFGGLAADRWSGKAGLAAAMGLGLAFVFLFLHSHGLIQIAAAVAGGLAVVSSHPTTVVYAQRLLPAKVGLASGAMLGFGLGLGSVAAVLLGLWADRFGLSPVMHLIVWFPLAGLLFSLLLPVPTQERILLAERQMGSAQGS